MCKIMQNVANHVLFTKEVHMRIFNEFLKTNFEPGRKFVDVDLDLNLDYDLVGDELDNLLIFKDERVFWFNVFNVLRDCLDVVDCCGSSLFAEPGFEHDTFWLGTQTTDGQTVVDLIRIKWC